MHSFIKSAQTFANTFFPGQSCKRLSDMMGPKPKMQGGGGGVIGAVTDVYGMQEGLIKKSIASSIYPILYAALF